MNVPFQILQQHVAVLGKTRSGKSSVMRVLVEHLIETGMPVCIVDPKGDWWGIKLARDGKSRGFPVVIFGGEHADIPIDEHSGAQVAELFATGNRPCIIDMGGWMVAPRTRFWIDFASTLFRHSKGSRWLAVDEIHNFAPKGKIPDPDAGKALHWTNRLASEGLGKGIQMVFASQRPQKVHNDTLTSAETLIAMRVLHPSDRGAVSDWIKGCGDSEGSEVLNSLAQMERGEGWVWSPEIGFGPKRVKFPMFSTYDSFRAQSVEDAQSITGWAEMDIAEIQAKFAAAGDRMKADDPKELRRRLNLVTVELNTLKAKTPAAAPLVPKVEADPSWVAENKRLQREIAQLRVKFKRIQELVVDENPFALPVVVRVPHSSGAAPPKLAVPVTAAIPQMPGHLEVGHRYSELVANPSASERKLLVVLANARQGKTIKELAVMSGYAKGGRFNNLLGALRTKGYVTRGEPVTITAEGLTALGPYDALPTGIELQQYWLNKLNNSEARVLRPLLECYPAGMTPDELRGASGYEAGGRFNNILGRLRTLDIVRRGIPIRAADTLFN